jgi:hypothetical protein
MGDADIDFRITTQGTKRALSELSLDSEESRKRASVVHSGARGIVCTTKWGPHVERGYRCEVARGEEWCSLTPAPLPARAMSPPPAQLIVRSESTGALLGFTIRFLYVFIRFKYFFILFTRVSVERLRTEAAPSLRE